MKQKIKFYLRTENLRKEQIGGNRIDFSCECECVSPSLFQDAIGSMGGGVYEMDVQGLPNHGKTPADTRIQRMWEQVDCALRRVMIKFDVYGYEINDITAAIETLEELQEIYK